MQPVLRTSTGYNRLQFERYKLDIRVRNRQHVVHGNTSISKEVSHVGMARVLLKKYIEGCGCPQPHRPKVRRKEDVIDTIPTILLPMNTRKLDILGLINEELATLGETCAIGKCAFYALWRSDFAHVKIPRTSRFSKCYVCWEYTSGLEALTNERMKDDLKRQSPSPHFDN